MRGRRVRTGSHGASHPAVHLGGARTHFAALSAAFGAAPMLSAKIWLIFAASGTDLRKSMQDSTLEHSILAAFNNP